MTDLSERFWAKVTKGPDCWLWRGARFNHGYGKVVVVNKFRLAHRISYLLHYGPIPSGHFICHHCDTPLCVRPTHLFLGTPADNAADRDAKGRVGDRSGPKNGRAKLTWPAVYLIRESALQGVSIAALSRAHGIAYSQIREIIRGESWCAR